MTARPYLVLITLDSDDVDLAEGVEGRPMTSRDVQEAVAAAAQEVYPLGGMDVRTTVLMTAAAPPALLKALADSAEVGAEGADFDDQVDLDQLWAAISVLRTVALGQQP